MSMINEDTKCIVIEEWTKGKNVLKKMYIKLQIEAFSSKILKLPIVIKSYGKFKIRQNVYKKCQ